MSGQTLPAERVKVQLLARRSELQQRRSQISQDLGRRVEPLSADSDDRAIQLENDEPLLAIDQSAGQELEEIDAALDQIARGKYGLCSRCGEAITTTRLAAVPQAVTCGRCSS